MKKWLSMIMVLALLVCLTACGENAATNADDVNPYNIFIIYEFNHYLSYLSLNY